MKEKMSLFHTLAETAFVSFFSCLVPDEPPSSVLVTPHTTSSVLVQWQPPKAESVNGLLLGYRIYYRELDYDTGPGTESKTIQNPSALRAELTRKPVLWTLKYLTVVICHYTRHCIPPLAPWK